MPKSEEKYACTTIRHVEPRTTTILCNLIAVRTRASEHVVNRKGAMSDSYEIQESAEMNSPFLKQDGHSSKGNIFLVLTRMHCSMVAVLKYNRPGTSMTFLTSKRREHKIKDWQLSSKK